MREMLPANVAFRERIDGSGSKAAVRAWPLSTNCGEAAQGTRMIAIDIPGRRELRLNHLVLDYNDTVAVDDKLLAGLLRCYGSR
jgi:hypothetical protein